MVKIVQNAALKSLNVTRSSAINFDFDEVNQSFIVELDVYSIDLGAHIQGLMGMSDQILTPGVHRGRAPMNPIHSLQVYCDLVEPRVVGDVLVPLLRIVPVKGSHGDTVSKSYENVHYVPLSRKTFQTVEIDIRDHAGDIVPFERGTLNVTLHFRRRRLL